MIRLHGYYRSSTSYRLRIALQLKGLDYEYVPVNLLESEQKGAAFTSRNPFGSVPLLEVDGKDYVQSMAQLEWLDEAYPDAPLLPGDAGDRYLARELAYAIATELHAPLNLPVLKYLAKEYGKSQDEIGIWYRHWLARTLDPLEARLAQLGSGDFLFERPGLFEVCLLPQVYNAQRFKVPLDDYPTLTAVNDRLQQLQAVQQARPENQPDAQ